MRHLVWVVATLLLLAVAAPCRDTPANGAPKYDKATEVKVKGTVIDVRDYECPISGTMGAHVTLKTSQGNIEVHVAATKYVKNYEMVFAKGDELEVIGSKVKFQGNDTIIAREAVRGQDTFTFRDKDGKPLW